MPTPLTPFCFVFPFFWKKKKNCEGKERSERERKGKGKERAEERREQRSTRKGNLQHAHTLHIFLLFLFWFGFFKPRSYQIQRKGLLFCQLFHSLFFAHSFTHASFISPHYLNYTAFDSTLTHAFTYSLSCFSRMSHHRGEYLSLSNS